MKNHFVKLTLIIGCMCLLSATFPFKKHNLYGKWKLVSGDINGEAAPGGTMMRYWEFNNDNSFTGEIHIQDQAWPYNQGIFVLPDDTTMVTIHADQIGNQFPVAYKYNYRIKNDSLHLYGFYLNPVPGHHGLMNTVHIDEWWVKVE